MWPKRYSYIINGGNLSPATLTRRRRKGLSSLRILMSRRSIQVISYYRQGISLGPGVRHCMFRFPVELYMTGEGYIDHLTIRRAMP
jgi:hypothetical protein